MTQDSFYMELGFSGQEDNNYAMNFYYSDSDGREINEIADGDDPMEVLEDLIANVSESFYLEDEVVEEEESDEAVDDVYADLLNQINDLEEQIEFLNQELESTRIDNDILQRRADDAVKESNDTKKYNEGSDWSSFLLNNNNFNWVDYKMPKFYKKLSEKDEALVKQVLSLLK